MPTDPKAQTEAQLRRIEEALGKTAADVTDEVRRNGIERHSEVVGVSSRPLTVSPMGTPIY